jgi:aminoglycoside phosphotransferase (APT) family kinase protein
MAAEQHDSERLQPEEDQLRGVDLGRLGPYLDSKIGLAGPLQATLIHGGRSNLTYRLTDGSRDWVLRRPPLGNVLPSAHDMAREYRVISALHPSPVPVPAPVLLCQDHEVLGTDFYLMQRVDGPVLRGAADTRDLSLAQAAHYAEQLIATLVQIHSVDIAVLENFGRPAGYMSRQVSRWRRQWGLSATRTLPAVEKLADRLEASVPQPQAVSLVHGDYRLDNLIFHPGEFGTIAAVIDWEMATLGDPLADLGLLLVYWDPITESVTGAEHAISANPGFPSTSKLAELYLKSTGCNLSHLDFYVAFGYFKLAVIAEGIHARYLAGRTLGRGFETVGGVVPTLVQKGLEALG